MFDQILKMPTYAALMATPASVGQLGIDLSTMATYQHNGTGWMPLARTSVKASTVTVNGMAVGSTLIYTLENNPLNFVPTDISITKVSQTGIVLTQPAISIGTNAPAYDDVAGSSILGVIIGGLGLGTTTPHRLSVLPKLPGGTAIYARVSTAATGATALTFNVDLIGYYKA
jgi:hypothetical protein